MINPDELKKLITCDGVGKQAKQEIVDRVIAENVMLSKKLSDWKTRAFCLARQLKAADRPASEQALKHFEELSG